MFSGTCTMPSAAMLVRDLGEIFLSGPIWGTDGELDFRLLELGTLLK